MIGVPIAIHGGALTGLEGRDPEEYPGCELMSPTGLPLPYRDQLRGPHSTRYESSSLVTLPFRLSCTLIKDCHAAYKPVK